MDLHRNQNDPASSSPTASTLDNTRGSTPYSFAKSGDPCLDWDEIECTRVPLIITSVSRSTRDHDIVEVADQEMVARGIEGGCE